MLVLTYNRFKEKTSSIEGDLNQSSPDQQNQLDQQNQSDLYKNIAHSAHNMLNVISTKTSIEDIEKEINFLKEHFKNQASTELHSP